MLNAKGERGGLTGSYYQGAKFDKLVGERMDRTIDIAMPKYEKKSHQLIFPGLRPGPASIRWVGEGGFNQIVRSPLAESSDEEILALAGPDSVVVDLGGRAIMPGFVDAHAHPYWEGLISSRPSLESAPDLRAARGVCSAAARAAPPHG